MGAPSTTLPAIDFPLSAEQRKLVAARAPYCYADNCYRALFPCPSPWVVTAAVLYCATVSDDSATNYPTQAIAACGTGKKRYISACSCPATNCPVTDTAQETATIPQSVSSAVTTTTQGGGPPENDPATTSSLNQAAATSTHGETAPTQIPEDVGTESDQQSSGEPANEPTATEPAVTVPPSTGDTPLNHVSSTPHQTANPGESVAGAHPTSISHTISDSQLLLTILGHPSASSLPSSPTSFPPDNALSNPGSTAPSGPIPPSTTSPPGSTDPDTPRDGARDMSVSLVAAIAVIATLAALLLLGAAAYCGLKRRTARRRNARLRALTLSRESRPSGCGLDVAYEWKPPTELPHQNTAATTASSELADAVVLRAQLDGSGPASPFPVSPSALSTVSSLPPAELFVLPAELSGVEKN